MSQLLVDDIVNKEGTSSPGFSKGVIVTGVCTATTIKGALTGNVTGNVSGTAGGLSGTPDITVNNIVGVAATFTGALTYEDVTNIDSIGIITARSDLSIADKIIHTGDTNTALRFPAADTITAETAGSERLRIDSDGYVRIGSSGAGTGGSYPLVVIDESNRTTTSATQLNLYAKHDGSGNTGVGFGGGIRFWGDRNGDNAVQNMGRVMCIADVNSGTTLSSALVFETAAAGVNAERLRIASNGQVSISNDGTTDGLLTIKGDSDAVGTPSIRLLDGSDTREVSISNTSGDLVISVHGNDNVQHGFIKLFESGVFKIANDGSTERFGIASSGNITISSALTVSGITTAAGGLTVAGTMVESMSSTTTAYNSNGNLNITNGNFHFSSANLGGTGTTLNIMSTAGINTTTKVNQVLNVTAVTAVNATTAFVNKVTIDGKATGITTHWVGGEVPSAGGGSGVDTYSFNILKTGSETYIIVANQILTSS